LTIARPARQAIIEITTKDGRHLRHHTKAVLGTPDNPMAAAQVEAKAHDLMSPILGAARATVLIEAIRQIEEMQDVRDLRPLLSLSGA
jgi:hypothetical protein